MIFQIQHGLREDGYSVPMTKLCRWFEVPRRTVDYRPVKSAPKVQARFAAPIKQLIEADPSFGYRAVAGRRSSTADRGAAIGCDDAERSLGNGPAPGMGGPGRLADLGLQLSHARTARLAALEKRPGDDGDVGTREGVDREVRDARTRHDAVPDEVRQRPGVHLSGVCAPRAQLLPPAGVRHAALLAAERMIERFIRTLKDQCIHRHRFETPQYASRVIGEWIRFYNTRRPHQALGMKTPRYRVCLSGLA
jgi:putative transposase